jgi:hypothetical protein
MTSLESMMLDIERRQNQFDHEHELTIVKLLVDMLLSIVDLLLFSRTNKTRLLVKSIMVKKNQEKCSIVNLKRSH